MAEHERASVLPPSDALSAAIDAARHSPDNDAHWDLLEELVDGAQRPSDVRALFREVLSDGELAPTVAAQVGQRAVRFYEAWYGDDSSDLADLLTRVLQRDQSADWAFERLTVALTAAERWNDLLGVYDAQIAHERDERRRSKLLDDAAQLAKDFAAQPDRAVSYMMQLFTLQPNNATLASSLERLLERMLRWTDLIELWRTRGESQPPRQKRDTYLRMASCYLDALHEPAHALRELEVVLHETADYKPGLDLAERILVAPGAASPERRGALRHLRDYHVRNQAPHEVVRVLELALGFSTGDERRALLRELVERSIDLRDDARAVVHQASLLVLEPLPQERDTLRALTERTRSYEAYAVALAAAAEACQDPKLRIAFWLETGRVREETLGQADQAIDFYSRVFRAEADPDSTIAAGRRLLSLLERTDRERDTLDVLMRMAEIEPVVAVRKTLLGKLAQLAERLGESERARRAWGSRVDDDGEDLEALAALISVAERDQDYAALASLLRKRTRVPGASHQRRADLIWLAKILDEKLQDVGRAIDAWRELRASFGDDPEAVNALTELLGRAGRWDELADVLRQATQGEVHRFTELQSQLGDAYRVRLDKPELAAACYRSALLADPRHEAARAGQQALLDVESCRVIAVNSLHDAYRETGEWEAALGLLDRRLAIAADDAARAALWIAAAGDREKLGKDPQAALDCYRRAFTLAPNERDTEREIRRLAGQLNRWDAVVAAYRETIASFSAETPRVAELRYEEGQTLEQRLADPAAALEAYAHAARIAKEREAFASAAARLAAELGQWQRAADVLLACAAAKGDNRDVPFAMVDELAGKQQAWEPWCQSLEAGLRDAKLGLRAPQRRAALRHLALLQRDQRGDLAAAEVALSHAAEAGEPDLATLRELADTQRTLKSARLLSTLRQLIELDQANLDTIAEAAGLASDAKDKIGLLETLYERASSLWRREKAPTGQRSAEAGTLFAIDELCAVYRAQNKPERVLQLLHAATRLPFDAAKVTSFLRQAAALALELPAASERAIALYRELLAREPADAEALAALAKLYEQAGWLPELLSLRRHELSLDAGAKSGNRRLALRLENVRLLDALVARGERLSLLNQNLADEPGHKPSLEAINRLLRDIGNYAELVRIFEAQARLLAGQSQKAQAAWLWRQVAGLRELELHDAAGALGAYRELYDLEPAGDASAALARLYGRLGEHARAAEWLERRLESAPASERAQTAVALARAHIDAGQSVQARAALEQALFQDPTLAEARELLADLYRKDGAHEQLAQVLAQGESSLTDPARRLAYLREAADLYCERLNDPARAIPVLTRATELAPNDVRLRSMLAEGLRAAGRYEEAKSVLRAIIDGFGRKRSPERAEFHYQWARIAASAGQVEEAFSELEQATKMDLGHKQALHMLAGLSQQQGDLDRAERAYRSLLLLLRRQKPENDAALGPAEVLYQLYQIAVARQQEQAANELLASALEAAGQDEQEAKRFMRVLRARGETELSIRVLDARLAATREPKLEAELLGTKAAILEEQGQLGTALELRLRAIALDEHNDELHAAAMSLAQRADELGRYTDALGKLADDAARTRTPVGVRSHARHTLRLGHVVETQLHDYERAAGLYAKVEASGECTIDAWLSLARVAGARGDHTEQRRVLLRVAELDEERIAKSERNAARFLLAELELREAAWRDAGVETLRRALQASQDYARAKAVIAGALEHAKEHPPLLALSERVARESHDEVLLLACLELGAQLDTAKLESVREAIDLALRRNEPARAERLLERARQLHSEHAADGDDPSWVYAGLVKCRLQAGDTAAAMRYLNESIAVAAEPLAQQLMRELAQLASGPGGDLPLAAATYARLLEREPADRTLWEPMLRVLMQLPDAARLNEFVVQTLSGLLMLEDRAFMMLTYADHLLSQSDDQTAAGVLLQLLDEAPTHTEASEKLLAIYQRHGMQAELQALLERQFDRARDERDVTAICELGLKLGKLYAETDRDRACDIVRSALDWQPEQRELLQLLLGLLPEGGDAREQCNVLMRLLKTASGAEAAQLALEVAKCSRALGDDEQEREALEQGYRGLPSSDAVREQLEACYARQERFAELAELMQLEATRLGPGVASVARLRNAAALYRDSLQDLEAAANALRTALALQPDDLSLLRDLVRDQAAAGQHAAAVEDISRLLASQPGDNARRVELLRMRAEVHHSAGMPVQALADIEEAHTLAGDSVLPELMNALITARDASRDAGAFDDVRATTLRLVELLDASGESERANAELAALSEWLPEDIEILVALRERHLREGRFDEAIESCTRLIPLTQGEAQVAAALTLAECCEQLGRGAEALPWLLQVHEVAPTVWPLRERLRQLFTQSNQQRELAQLLMGDADIHEQTADKLACYQQAAQLFLALGDPESASEPLQKATLLAPDDDITRLSLVDLDLALGRVDNAAESIEQAFALHKKRSPELARYQLRMARVFAVRGDTTSQLKWLNTALETDRKSGEVASELVDAAMVLADYDTAMKALRTLTMMEDPQPITRAMAFLKQAEIAYLRGDPQRALHWARKAKSLDESLHAADELLAKLEG